MSDPSKPEAPTPSRPGPPEGEAPREHFDEGEESAPPGVRAMAIVRWLLVIGMAIAAVASLVHVFGDTGQANGKEAAVQYYCPMHPSVVQDHPGECPICSMTLVRRESAAAPDSAPAAQQDHAGHPHQPSDPYYCPMHPDETGPDAAARCPLCGMQLERRPAAAQGAEHAGHAAGGEQAGGASKITSPPAVSGLIPVEISAERVQLIGMRTAQVQRATLPSALRAVGYVAPTESGLAVIQPRFSGWIQELHVTQTGQAVARGQLLARVYSPDLLAAQQELLNAKRWGAAGPEASPREAGGTALLEHARSRLSLLGMDPEEIEEVERTGSAHRLIELRSPVKGYVAQKNALEGLFIQPGTRLFEVADLSKVWVMVEVFERDAGRVQTGQTATLTLAAFPGRDFQGKVQLVYPALSADTRTLRARLEFKNPDLRLRPGMFGDVAIQVTSSAGLLVPREAVVDTGQSQYVFVAESGGRFTPRAVRVGEQSAEHVQILSGLSEGETVVTTGNFLIDSESRLRATIEGRAQPAHAGH